MNTHVNPLRLSLLAGAGLAAALCATAVQAQPSSVTVFGIADLAIRQVRNEGRGSITSQVSGSNSTSRLGFRGTEDLGAGLAAGFHLEHGVQLDTGNPVSATMFWDRRSTVSLLSKTLGEIRLGRDFVPTYSNWGRYDPFSYVGAAGANNFIGAGQVGPIREAFGTSGNTTVRSSNAVQVLLPSGLGGLEGGLMVAAREGGTAANGQHKMLGLRLGYATGAYGVSAAYTRSENDLTVAGPIKDAAIGAHVSVVGMRFTAAYRTFTYSQAKQANLLLAAVMPVGKSGEVKASWHRVDMRGRVGTTDIGANDARQIGLGYVHSLSKRTVLYATYSRIDNQGAATFVVPGGPSGITGGRNSTGVDVGVRHTF